MRDKCLSLLARPGILVRVAHGEGLEIESLYRDFLAREVTLIGSLRFENGAVASLPGTYDSSYNYRDTQRVEVNGTRGRVPLRTRRAASNSRAQAMRPRRYGKQMWESEPELESILGKNL